jgi:adenine deaminase
MTDAPSAQVVATLSELKEVTHQLGSALPEPFLQLAFLSLPVIGKLKLTDKGLVDVDQFKVVELFVQ